MSLLRRFANLFQRSRVAREIDAELASHIALRTEANRAAGMPEEEARRDALLRFGNPLVARERVTAADTALGLESFWFDLRFSLRQLFKAPGFTLTAVLTLAVAIGANALVFSVLNALVLRPLDLPGAQNLYTIDDAGETMNSYPDYIDLRDRNVTFDGIALYDFESVGLDTGGDPRQTWIYEISSNYFQVLQVHPFLGRFFTPADDHGRNSIPYLVLSYPYWRTRFHADPSVVGRAVQVNRHAFTILGVAPPGFRGSELIYQPDLWAPVVDQMQIEGSYSLDHRRDRSFWLIGRVKSGVTAAQAEGDMNAIAAQLAKTYPVDDSADRFSFVRPGLVGDLLGGPVRAFVAGLDLLAALILLAACANLGSLFAARAADRAREIALRLALGSSRLRILRQLLTEAMLIAFAGGAAGIAAAVFLLRALSAWRPVPAFPITVPVNPDARTYAVAVVLALLSGLLCALAPVRQVFATAPWQVVKSGIAGARSRRRIPVRDVLLVVQVTVCAVLMTASLVAVRGLLRSLHSSFGFDPHHALLVNNDLNMAGFSGDRVPAMQRRMLDAVSTLPGVTAAGFIDNVPLGIGWSMTSIYPQDATDFRESKELAEAMQYAVSPGYLRAAGTALLAGRDVAWSDAENAPHVVLVNRTFALKVFGSVQNAVGAHFRQNAKDSFTVVGVVEDGKYTALTEDARLAFFAPLLQSQSMQTWLVIRAAGDPGPLAGPVHDALRALDDTLPLQILTWDREQDSALFAARAATVSLGVLGALGALLALTGIFGMASYTVGKRLREMGIRMALGAGHGKILSASLGRAFRLLAFGSVAGMLLGMAATRLLAYIVYQASPQDPVVLLGALLAMLLLGLLATWAPAQRALSVNPSRLMREE